MYRLHVDISVGTDLEVASAIAKRITDLLVDNLRTNTPAWASGLEINYRLGNDQDRQKSNHLDINKQGHCSNKKISVCI